MGEEGGIKGGDGSGTTKGSSEKEVEGGTASCSSRSKKSIGLGNEKDN